MLRKHLDKKHCSMNEHPLVTIHLLAYNSEKTIGKTLGSLATQTYPNFELLISDNGSTDKTIEIIKSFQREHAGRGQRIILRHNIPDIKPGEFYDGCYDNCNGCIKSGLMNGDFVSFFHSDDIYEKDIIKKEVEFLLKNPQAGAIFTLGTIINKNDRIIGYHKLPRELKEKNVYNFMEIFKALLKNGNTFLLTPTFMARTDIFKKMGLFNITDFQTSADLGMWLKIAENYPIGILNENLINWRAGGGEKTYRLTRVKRANFFKVIDHYLEKNLLSSVIDKKILRQYEYQKDFDDTLLALNLLKKNEMKKAKSLINKPFSSELLKAYFENLTILRTKVLVLKIILFIGINIGLGKGLGRILLILQDRR
jgi:glycosyltransferase involved in cell wall biosynthesis